MAYFYTLFSADPDDTLLTDDEAVIVALGWLEITQVVATDGPFETQKEALDNALLNAAAGEPVYRVENAVEFLPGHFIVPANPGDFSQAVVAAVANNEGCLRR